MSKQSNWWIQIRSEPTKLIDWLSKEYYATLESARVLRDAVKLYLDEDDEAERIIYNKIVAEREMHALWIRRLLDVRGEQPGLFITEFSPSDFASSEELAANSYKLTQAYIANIQEVLKDKDCVEDLRNAYYNIWLASTKHLQALKILAGTEYYKVK